MKIIVQCGFCRNVKEGQLITVSVNGKEVDTNKCEKKWLTGVAQRYTNCWYLIPLDCSEGDIIVVDVRTGIRQKGADERRTFRKTYKVTEQGKVITVAIDRVGKYGFPLIKGRIEEISSVSKEQERLADAETFLDEAFDDASPSND